MHRVSRAALAAAAARWRPRLADLPEPRIAVHAGRPCRPVDLRRRPRGASSARQVDAMAARARRLAAGLDQRAHAARGRRRRRGRAHRPAPPLPLAPRRPRQPLSRLPGPGRPDRRHQRQHVDAGRGHRDRPSRSSSSTSPTRPASAPAHLAPARLPARPAARARASSPATSRPSTTASSRPARAVRLGTPGRTAPSPYRRQTRKQPLAGSEHCSPAPLTARAVELLKWMLIATCPATSSCRCAASA